jgi:centrosomal CEP192-like protein/HYDIN/CFA65/VesB family protein/galactose oxidase-like protein
MCHRGHLRTIHKGSRGILPQAAVLALLCASLTTSANTAFAQQGTFVPTGNMNSPREGHTATLLNNGKVLVAGGSLGNGISYLATTELYDPTTGTFTDTGSLNAARGSHTATLLNNGKVLVAGGSVDGTRALASSELYDPATGTFSPTGSMNTTRVGHTATLLNNGTVLIAGGVDILAAELASAELYDPATGTFSPTGSMNTTRGGYTAALLNNGKVLFAGGSDSSGFIPLASSELYDPTIGTFTPTGSMNAARVGPTATLLNDGKVLVAGGYQDIMANFIFVVSGELYDPTTGTFSPTGSLNTGRNGHTATLLNNGKVLFAGGFSAMASSELFDPTTGTFAPTGSLNTGRNVHTATLLNNGTVLVAGGVAIQTLLDNAVSSAELYELVIISPTSLSFTSQIAGTTSAFQSVLLTNNQSTALSITSIAFSGTNSSDFVETDNCVGSVAAGASCSINVTFTPAAVGSRTGNLNIANNLSGSPMPVPLTGIGVAATRIVSLSASSLTFTNQMVGLTSPAQGITLNNSGNSTLTLSGLAFSGTNATEFAETDNCGGSIAAGATCTINVTFSPTASGTRTGTLSITDNATSPASPQTVALTGTAAPPAPVVFLSPANVVFPNQVLNMTSAPQFVTLYNEGAAMLNIKTVTIAGAYAGDFAIASGSTCANGVSVAPNASCEFQLTFTPTGLLIRSATVGIADNAADSPETINLVGVTYPTPLVSVAPSNITFRAQYVGTSGLPQSVTITNNGNAPLSITSVTTSTTDFGTLDACGSTVAAGSSCAIGVFFDPTASGTRPGTLTINDNAPGSPHTVALSGTGQDFSLAPVSPASTIVSAGQMANFTVAVSPAGGFNQTVALTCTGAPALSTCAVTPSSVPLNGTAAVNIVVSMTTMAASPPLIIPFPRADYRLLHLSTGLLELLLLIGLLSWRRGRLRLAYGLALLVFVFAGVMMSACSSGSSGNQRTPPGTYPLVVSGTFTSGSTKLTHNANLTLVVQ